MSRLLKRNNIIAGGFLIGGLVLAVLVAFWIGDGADALLADRAKYVFRFTVADGVAGVDEGSVVTLGGTRVGKVLGLGLVPAEGDQSGVPRFVDVRVEIERDVPLYDNAVPQVVTPLLGTLASINIASPGGPGAGDAAAALLAEGGLLRGSTAPGLLAQAGLEPEQVRGLVADARGVIRDAQRISSAFADDAEPTATDLRATVAEFRRFAELVNSKAEAYADQIDGVLVDARAFSGRLDPIATSFEALMDDTRVAVSSANDAFDSLESAIDDNRTRIDAALENAAAIVQNFRDQTSPQLDRLLGSANRVAENADASMSRVNALLDTETPGIRRTLANIRLVSDRATVFFEEVSAAPWRLLNRPGRKEMEEEIVYDAARQYATAVSRLRAASDSLDAALQSLGQRGPSPGLDAESLAAMQATLVEAFDRYRETEQTLLRVFSDRFSDKSATPRP